MKFFGFTRFWRGLVAAVIGWALFAGVRVGATTVIPPDFDQLVNESDYIIRASVKSVTSEFRTNSAGRTIFTKVSLNVLEVIAGNPPTDVVLEILGGKVGNEQMVLEGAPRFKVGDEDILFVRDNGRVIVPLVAMMHGRYPILHGTDGKRFVARENKTPLSDTAEVSQPMTKEAATSVATKTASVPLTPEEFVQRIKAAVNPRYVRTKS